MEPARADLNEDEGAKEYGLHREEVAGKEPFRQWVADSRHRVYGRSNKSHAESQLNTMTGSIRVEEVPGLALQPS